MIFKKNFLYTVMYFVIYVLLPFESMSGELNGIVKDSTLMHQPSMTIKLTPPKSKNIPHLVTRTGPTGEYQFKNIEEGKYKFEMFYGPQLIRREIISVKSTTVKNIELTSRR